MILWTDKTAAEATDGKAQGTWQASRVEIDSRKIQPGDLFVALKGDNFDGHDFVEAALAKGAVAAVVSKNVGKTNLLVADTQKALDDLGRYSRARANAKIIGVTGSVGKTSTKEMLRLALSAHGKTYATSGNYNNHIGTPLNLANLPPDTEFAVFEMGMNHAGEIAHLTKMVRPDIAAITNIEAVHMEFFPSLEAIADAKAEIFEGLPKNGTAILNADSPQYAHLRQAAVDEGVSRLESFSEAASAGCRLISYRATTSGCAVEADIFGKRLHYTLGAVGKHWALTSLLTLAVTHALGLDDEKTAKVLAGFSELDGRGRIITINRIILIDDSYNASPAAMRAAFAKTVEVWEASGKKGRKMAALGNMLELGPEAPQLHAMLAKDLERNGFDGVFTAGDLMKHLHEALPEKLRAGHVSKALELLPLLQKELHAGDILLVKGSHGSKIYELAKALQETTGEKQKHAV